MTQKADTENEIFRFQSLEIWKKAVDIGERLLDIAEDLEKRRLYRFAEQVHIPLESGR